MTGRVLLGPQLKYAADIGSIGALLLVSADIAARRALAPTELPVGLITGILGAPYLMWLLVRMDRGWCGSSRGSTSM